MAKYFLISNHLRDSIARSLERYAEEHNLGSKPLWHYHTTIKQAPTIELPEIHTFQEADKSEFIVCAFNEEEAKERANRESWRKKPLTWTGSFVVWPGVMDSVNLTLNQEEDEPYPEDSASTLPHNSSGNQPTLNYPAAARAIALWLDKFCNRFLPYPDMIAQAAREAAQHIDKLEAQIASADSNPPF